MAWEMRQIDKMAPALIVTWVGPRIHLDLHLLYSCDEGSEHLDASCLRQTRDLRRDLHERISAAVRDAPEFADYAVVRDEFRGQEQEVKTLTARIETLTAQRREAEVGKSDGKLANKLRTIDANLVESRRELDAASGRIEVLRPTLADKRKRAEGAVSPIAAKVLYDIRQELKKRQQVHLAVLLKAQAAVDGLVTIDGSLRALSSTAAQTAAMTVLSETPAPEAVPVPA